MLPETIALEALRQKIEAALQESGSLSDYLDRGRPNASEAALALRKMTELAETAAAGQRTLALQVAATRAACPQAFEQWVALHVDALLRITSEPPGDAIAETRRTVAAETIKEWHRVRAGEQTFVSINWYYLSSHQSAMRRLLSVLPC
jgi:hypothetical protein